MHTELKVGKQFMNFSVALLAGRLYTKVIDISVFCNTEFK